MKSRQMQKAKDDQPIQGRGRDGKDDSSVEAQEEAVRERTAPPGEVVYEAIHREGEHELERPLPSLAWSGLAAGLSMGFSLVAEGLLRSHLPTADWTPVVTKFGYSVGFLIVILGRQQLFTKNTLTVILPLFGAKKSATLVKVARLWAVVLLTNLTGAFLFSLLLAKSPVVDAETRQQMTEIANIPVHYPFWVSFVRSIVAGWLIALMIWLIPYAETARVWVITLLAYVVGLGHFPHIVAGSAPMFFLVLSGQLTFGAGLTQFLLPVLLGNIVGGVALVAAGVHAEFTKEARESSTHSRR